MPSDVTKVTEAVLAHHLRSIFDGNVAAILEDYDEQSVLYLPQGPVRGLEQLRAFFIEFLENKPEGFLESFEILRQDVDQEIAYLVWSAGPSVPLGTDTFVVRDGKIRIQTLAAYMDS